MTAGAAAAGARALFQAGRLDEAVLALGAELRGRPGDDRARTFLFELLAFAGEYGRAERQLAAVAPPTPAAEQGARVYRAALHAEAARQAHYAADPPAAGNAPAVAGRLNGAPFSALEDADPRVGARLEVFAGDRWLRIPFAQLSAVRVDAPARLRDLLWAQAQVAASAAYGGVALGAVLLPALAPLTWRHPDGAVRLGRATTWDDGGVPAGQKLLLVDGEPVPFLEVREIEIHSPA